MYLAVYICKSDTFPKLRCACNIIVLDICLSMEEGKVGDEWQSWGAKLEDGIV